MASSDKNKPVHTRSIQWIDLKKVLEPGRLSDATKESLSNATATIIRKYNERILAETKNKDEPPIYEPGLQRNINAYSLQHYMCRKASTTNIAVEAQENPEDTVNFTYIVFFHKENTKTGNPSSHPCIIALTCGNAWQVVRPYVDYSFPVKICEKVGEPTKMIQIVRRCLYGDNIRQDLLYPADNELYSTSNLYYLVESFKCDIKNDSKLFALMKNENEETPSRCWIKVTTGGLLKMNKKLPIRDYLPVFDLFIEYMNTTQGTVDPVFKFLQFIQPARSLKSKLDLSLVNHIYTEFTEKKEIPLIHVRHARVEDFLLADSFKLKIDTRSHKLKSMPPNIEEIIQDIISVVEKETKASMEKTDQNNKLAFTDQDKKELFIKKIQNSKLIFKDQASQPVREKIIDCFEGEHQDSEITYFKIKKMWYELEPYYLSLLCEDFKRVMTNTLIEEHSEWRLPRPWKTNDDEDVYCRSYIDDDDQGYLVFDQILPDRIESCDILKYNDDSVYLYHVKEKIGQVSRDACSQILNAATLIRSTLVTNHSPNYLEKLWNEATKDTTSDWRQRIKKKVVALGKDPFMHIFRSRKIVFVYAYRYKPGKSFREKLTKIDKIIDPGLIEKLINAGYLDSNKRLTAKFFSTVQKDFKIDGEKSQSPRSKEIYNMLAAYRFDGSNIGKMELVRLAQNLQNLNFQFKVCEIEEIDDAKQENTPDDRKRKWEEEDEEEVKETEESNDEEEEETEEEEEPERDYEERTEGEEDEEEEEEYPIL